MLRTSKQQSEGQSFHRQLLSEYNTDITLSNYVAYFELKAIAKEVEQLREAMEKRAAEIIKTNQDTHLRTFPSISAEGSVGSTPAKPAVMVFPRNNSISAFNMDPHSPLAQDCEDALRNDAALAEMSTKRQALHMRFFADLRASYKKVKMFLLTLEREMIVCVEQLRKQTEADIRNLDDEYIPSLYLKLQTILKYRHLNLLAFRKIMKKFLERCATDDLELQRRVVEIDDTINNSTVSRPTLDLRGIALQLVALYGTVYKYSYEEAIKHLRQYECRSGMNAQRLIPNSNTFFFTDAFPYQDPPGSFAIRVLAGSCSLFCEKMITELLQCQRTKAACCGRFANGEVSVQLPSPVRGDDVFILQSMVAQQHNQLSNAGSVMELALMTQAAHMSGAARITAVIPYLAYTRNTASIAAIAEVIESMGCHHVVTVDMHSDQVEGMFSIPMESISAQYEFVRFLCQQLKAEGDGCTALTVVATSGNFLGRAKDFADAMMGVGELDPSTQFVSVCTAVKRVPPTLPVRSQSPATIAARAAGLRHLASSSATGTPVVADLNDVAAMDSPAVLGAFATAGEVDMLFGEEEEEELPDDDNEFSINYSTMVNANTIADAPAEELRMMSQLGQESPLIAVRETSSTPFGAWSSSHGGTPAQRNVGRFPRHLTDGTNSDDATTPSTFGMEKALRRQEKGRRAILTERVDTKTIENIALVGEVRGRVCIILDTVIDEAIHICQVARSLEAHGASRIILCATHAVMSGQAPARLVDAPIDLIVVTDSINQDEFMKQPKLARKMRVVPIAPLLSRSIEKIHTESTLRTLFDKN